MHASCAPSLAYPRAKPWLLRGCRLRQFGRTSRKCGASDTYSSEKPRSMMPLTTRPAATRTAPRRIANRMAIPFQGFSRFGVMASLSRGGRPLAPKQRPGAKRKRRVEDREEKEEMRENAGQGKRHQYERDEQQAIDDRWRDDLARFRPSPEHAKPSDDDNRDAENAHQCLLLSSEDRVAEERLGNARPDQNQ